MKYLNILLITLLIVGFAGGTLYADQKADKNAQEAEMMKKWQDFATPGPEHDGFKYFHGGWHIDSISYMDPTKPEKAHLHGKAAPVLGGRHFVSTVEGKLGGMKFSGKMILGFDKYLKKYKGIWINNLGTGMVFMEGEPMGDKKEMVLKATYKCIFTGQDIHMRTITKIIDQNKYTFKIYEKGGIYGPKERLSMDMTYVRHIKGRKYH